MTERKSKNYLKCFRSNLRKMIKRAIDFKINQSYSTGKAKKKKKNNDEKASFYKMWKGKKVKVNKNAYQKWYI